MNRALEKYQTGLGALPQRPCVLQPPPEPIQQPEETQPWTRMQTSALAVVVCVVAFVLVEVAVLLAGGGL